VRGGLPWSRTPTTPATSLGIERGGTRIGRIRADQSMKAPDQSSSLLSAQIRPIRVPPRSIFPGRRPCRTTTAIPQRDFTRAGRSGTDRVELLHSTSLVPSSSPEPLFGSGGHQACGAGRDVLPCPRVRGDADGRPLPLTRIPDHPLPSTLQRCARLESRSSSRAGRGPRQEGPSRRLWPGVAPKNSLALRKEVPPCSF
jgi:hypothetical protein